MRLTPWLAAALTAGLLAGGLAAPTAAFASGTTTWTGNGDGETWTMATNWDNGVPQAGDSVVIAPTASESMPSVSGVPSGTSLKDLTLTNAGLAGGDVTVNGAFTWNVAQGQTVLDTGLTAKDAAAIGGAGKKIVFSKMTFDGDTTVSGTGQLETEFSAAGITNTGTFRIDPGALVQANACCSNPNKFINTGILEVPSGGTATLGMMGLSLDGAVSVGPDATLDVIGGPASFGPGSVVEGGGTLAFDQAENVKLAAGVALAQGSTVQLTGNAAFTGTGGFKGSGTFLWTGGQVAGNLDVGPTVTTTMSGSGVKDAMSLTNKPITVTLRGPSTLSGTGPLHLGPGGNLVNQGAFTADSGTTIEAGLCCANPNHFTNTGTFIAAAGKKPVTASLLAFGNAGTVKVVGKLVVVAVSYTQTAGVTNLSGGTLSSKQPVLIKGGTLTGHGLVGAPLVNGGTVSPSTTDGVLTVNGSYQQAKSGTFATVISGTTPGKKFGQLVVEGAATLAGTIKVTTSGGFKPKKGQSFQVMRYHSHTGSFGKQNGTPRYKVSYAGSVRVRY